jgi:hypothetical protein
MHLHALLAMVLDYIEVHYLLINNSIILTELKQMLGVIYVVAIVA